MSKTIDFWLKLRLKLEFRGRIEWKKVISDIYYKRWSLAKFRLESWIPGIVNELDIVLDEKMYELKNVIYIAFNYINRWIYIGQTKLKLLDRIMHHFWEIKCDVYNYRNKVKKMKSIGLEEWLFIPLKMVEDEIERKLEESRLIQKWKDHAINDRYTYTLQDNNDLVNNIKYKTWRMRILDVIKNEKIIERYDESGCYALLFMEDRYKLSNITRRKFFNIVINRLKTFDERMNIHWNIKVPYGKFEKKKMQGLIIRDVKSKISYNIGRWFEKNCKIVENNSDSIADVIVILQLFRRNVKFTRSKIV